MSLVSRKIRLAAVLLGGLAAVDCAAAHTIMVFNPNWITLGAFKPYLKFSASTPIRSMDVMESEDLCGWYAYSTDDISDAKFYIQSKATATGAEFYGMNGFGDKTFIDVTAYLSSDAGVEDTVWVSTSNATPSLSGNNPGDLGVCGTASLAMTVHDFSFNNPSFKHGWDMTKGGPIPGNLGGRDENTVCKKKANGYGIATGMVDKAIGVEANGKRHPVGLPDANGIFYERKGDCWDGDQVYVDGEDTRISTQWFNDAWANGAAGTAQNTTACRDLTLTQDVATGSFTYDNENFYPVDDFLRINPSTGHEDVNSGTLNPFNELNGPNAWNDNTGAYKDDNGKKHNYWFCLDSHGDFVYKAGQKFDFRGDDDVWFYINDQLVVDLGGIHYPPATGNVDLDDLGLTPGTSYKWDLFMCDRGPTASNLKITTSMGLRSVPYFYDSSMVKNSKTWSLMRRAAGSACNSSAVPVNPSKVVIQGTAGEKIDGNDSLEIPGGDMSRFNGGLVIAGNKIAVDVKTLLYAGWAEGTYTVTFVFPNGYRMTSTFTVLNLPIVEFKPYPPVMFDSGWSIPKNEPSIQLLVRNDSRDGEWRSVDGQPIAQPLSHYSGVLFNLNREISGKIYVYDNLGVAVASIDLSSYRQAYLAGNIKPTVKGDVPQLWVAWNGTGKGGVKVPTGIYLVRIVGDREEDGKRVFFNEVKKIGWSAP